MPGEKNMTRHEIERGANGENGHAPPWTGAAPMNKSLLHILWRGAWLIVLMAVVCVVGAFFYLSRVTPIYSSSARILIEAEGPVIIKENVDVTGQSPSYLAAQCELIKSTQILGPLGDDPQIRQMKTFAGLDNPVGLLKAGLAVEITKPDELVNISYESPYPADASGVVNAVVESYRTFYAKSKRSTAAEVLRILQKEKTDRDADLDSKNKAIAEFREHNPTLSYSSDKGNIIIEQLAKLAEALTTSHLEALEAKGEYQGAKAMEGDPAKMSQWIQLQGQSGGSIAQQAEVRQLQSQLAETRLNLLPGNDQVKSLEVKIDALKQTVQEQARQSFYGYLAVVEQRLVSAQQREETLQKYFDEQQAKALSLNTESAKIDGMLADAKRMEKLCDMLDSRIKEVRVTEDVGALNISVLEYAKPPTAPIKPKRSTVLFEALVLGLMLGGGLAYLRDWLDHRLNSVDEIREMLGLTLLGVLPNMPGREVASVRGQKVQLDPMSEVAEAYRTIRTAIYFGAPDGKAKTMLITSPAPGDGKTTTASNLAIAMAQAGQKVLLLDADFRKPNLHKIFALDGPAGITEVIAEKATLADTIKPSGIPGLSVLPCGPLPKNPSEILNSRAFSKLVEQLEESFDHIVIDSPPVMPVSDARILGALCDLTVLVLRAQKSTRRVSVQARESLSSVGARILGVVVNDVPKSRGGYGYYNYGYYQYGYRYGYGNRKSKSKAIEERTKAILPSAD
jgi:succinoglycan biosynthesis transport protein ExoP